MRGGIPPLPLYAFMAWCSVKAQEHLRLLIYLYLYLVTYKGSTSTIKNTQKRKRTVNLAKCRVVGLYSGPALASERPLLRTHERHCIGYVLPEG
jgi:hypothetical protein